MSKQIIVESKNGAINVDKSRQATNKSNLKDDSDCWREIVSFPDDYAYCTSTVKKGVIVFSFQKVNGVTSLGKTKLKKDTNITQILNTIFSRLCVNLNFNGFDSPSEISFKDLKAMAKLYLEADPKLQIQFCRNSTRQKVDEDVQAKTLATYVNDSFQTIKNGLEVLFDGKIISKAQAKKLKKEELDSRSVDIVGVIKQYQVKIFSKYAKVAGSGQAHQTNETRNWLKEAQKIKDKNLLFVAQLDGGEAESHIPELRKLVANNKNIFVGNSEQVIDWLDAID
jgi:hypothetical protein